jgi:hypothetical protein
MALIAKLSVTELTSPSVNVHKTSTVWFKELLEFLAGFVSCICIIMYNQGILVIKPVPSDIIHKL